MRSVLDKLVSWTGLVLAVVLLVAGGLLTWASAFVGGQVHDQFSAQHITMPTSATGLASLPKADRDALSGFAGQRLTNGKQAEAYANHFIAVHIKEAAAGKTYSEVSNQYLQQCSTAAAAKSANCQQLNGLKQTLFMGETLRGLLLYGYAFATIGSLAGYAAIAAFVAGLILLVLVALGFGHARRLRVAAETSAG